MPDIKELKKRISECKKDKHHLNNYIHKLNHKFRSKEIDYTNYFLKYKEVTAEKSIAGWNEYYDNEVKECEKEIDNLIKEEMIARFGLFILLSYITISLGINQLDLSTPTSLTVYNSSNYITLINDTTSNSIGYTIYDIIKR